MLVPFIIPICRLNIIHLICSPSLAFLSLALLLFCPKSNGAQRHPHHLSSPQVAEFELIYVAPGNGTYSLFGHLAVRVKEQKRDRIFDLGITSSMGLQGLGQVALGKALFHGEARSFPYMLKSWQRRDRSVTGYPLNLSPKLKTTLLLELESRLHGVAKPYLYDPLRANCATQIRQALDNVSGGTVTAGINHKINDYRFRDDTRDGYAKALGVLIAIEFLVGTSLDQERSLWRSTYRPLSLVKELKRLRIAGKKLLGTAKPYYIRQGQPTTGGYTIYYVIAVLAFLLGILLIFGWRRFKYIKENLSYTTGVHTELKSQAQSSSWLVVLLWFGYFLSSVLLISLFALALYLSIFSEWIEVRNSWLLVLGSPFDLLLLSFNPWSSSAYTSWLFETFKQRIAISMIMTLIFATFLTTLPTITLALSMFLLWGACLLLLSCLGSLPQEHIIYDVLEDTEDKDTANSWLDG